MSLSVALSSALSGLTAASRGAELVSSNLANALTEGYGRRDMELEARHAAGGGVRVLSTVRQTNPLLLSEARSAASEVARADVSAEFAQRLEGWLGTPDQEDSLFSDVKRFEAALVSAASRPDQEGRLGNVVSMAQSVVRRLNGASANIQDVREEADREISKAVTDLNGKLERVQKLNTQITSGNASNRDVSGLMDQRQVLIDEIAEWVPVKIMDRAKAGIALYTPGGIALLDGTASRFGFSGTHTISAEMTHSGGVLSGLSVNGYEVGDLSAAGALRGGRLSALFELRDNAAPRAQAEFDAFARDLAERFQTLPDDPTMGPADMGLFGDGPARFDAADEAGFSGRITVNPVVIESKGGAAWRLRDGLGAAVPGEVGRNALISSYVDTLTVDRAVGSGASEGAVMKSRQILSRMSEDFGALRLLAEQDATFARHRAAETHTALSADGVNSDQELQKLLVIEQAYAANAQVMRVAGEMLDELMRSV